MNVTPCDFCSSPAVIPVVCGQCGWRRWLCAIHLAARSTSGTPMPEHVMALHRALCAGPIPSRRGVN
jgi:hypothetical protein